MNASALILFSMLSAQDPSAQSELDKAVREAEAAKKPAIAQAQVGGATLRLIDVSVDVMFTAGTSTARDETIETLQGGGHDPHQRGFNVTQAELSFAGAVDPYFDAKVYAVLFISPEGETELELEEAYATTQTLPVQIKLGHYFTEFGRINPTHPHAWRFIDQPIVNTRMFGGDGMRAPGARGAYLLPVGFSSEVFFGVQNARGETVASFYGEPGAEVSSVGGYFEQTGREDVRSFSDLVYFLRWANGFDLSDSWSTQIGVSGLFGPNDTGSEGTTAVYGADFVVKWRPADHQRGWPFVLLEAEVMGRRYDVDDDFQSEANGAAVDEDSLRDWGFFAHVLWGFSPGWAAGVRFERAGGSGDSFTFDPAALPGAPVAAEDDPSRDDRSRVSLLLVFHPSEFSRLRLQYNHDDADHLRDSEDDDSVHSIWLSVEFLIGTHPPHAY